MEETVPCAWWKILDLYEETGRKKKESNDQLFQMLQWRTAHKILNKTRSESNQIIF